MGLVRLKGLALLRTLLLLLLLEGLVLVAAPELASSLRYDSRS